MREFTCRSARSGSLVIGLGIAIIVEPEVLELKVGARAAIRVPLNDVESVVQPSWRGGPAAGTPGYHDYRNLMKPATRNVLLTLAALALH